jgi:hypothetical protein
MLQRIPRTSMAWYIISADFLLTFNLMPDNCYFMVNRYADGVHETVVRT